MHNIVLTKNNDSTEENNIPTMYDRARLLADESFPCSMRGRIMFVVPFSLGPIGTYFSSNGVYVTDSPKAVIQLHIQTR